MRSKLFSVLAVAVMAFLLATNPMVSNAAGMITGKQIKNGSVTGKDITDHSVTAADVSGSIAGPAGPTGPQGPAGTAGSPGISNYTKVMGAPTTLPANSQVTAYATCPTGTAPLGGGASNSTGSTTNSLNDSFPIDSGWRVDYNNASNGPQSFTVYVLCAKVAN